MSAAHPFGTMLMASGNININNHVNGQVCGLSVEWDIVWSTLIAGAIIVMLGLLAARRATSKVPGKLQLFFETVVDQVNQLVESTVGPAGKRIVPLAFALFLFILTANWLEVIPSSPRGGTEYLPSPTGERQPHLCAGLGGDRRRPRRVGQGTRHTRIHQALLPAISLLLPDQRDRGDHEAHHVGAAALRQPVRGNPDAASHRGAPARVTSFPSATSLWKLFDMFIGLIQAFIFALLTIVYYGMATSHDEPVGVTEAAH